MNSELHIYTRVSSLVQSEDGTSLDTQKLDGIRKANELGLAPVVWNEGGRSSNSSDLESRPVLVELLEKVERGHVKNIYVYNTDRLSRNDRTWSLIRWKLKSNDVVLYTNTGRIDLSNPLDDLLMGLLSEISQYDNKIRTERSRRGKLFKVQQGYFQGGPTPYGYSNVNKRLVVNNKESQWVEFMYKQYSNGKSIHEIRRELNKNQVITRRGNPSWSLGSIALILQNKLYLGGYEYTDKKLNETVWVEVPAIIEKELWDDVQRKRKRKNERKHQINRSKHFYLLRDFMVCGHCGQKISGRIGKNNHFYYCPRKERQWVKQADRNGKACTMVRSLNIHKTDEVVWNSVLKIVKESKVLREKYREEFLSSVRDKRERSNQITSKLVKKKKKLNAELSEISKTIIDFEASVILKRYAGDSNDIRHKLVSEAESIKEKLRANDIEFKKLSDEQRWIDWLGRFEKDIDKKKEYSDQEKKHFLEDIIDEIRVFYNDEKKEHGLEIDFNMPIVKDELIYKNPLKHSDGWNIKEGENLYKVDSIKVDKGGRPSKIAG